MRHWLVACSLLAGCGGGSSSGDLDAAAAGADAAAADPGPDASGEQGGMRPGGVALCYTDLAEQHPATIEFRAALAEGRPEDRADAIDGLAAAAEEHPDEEELALLHGLAHLWRLAEPLPAESGDLLGQLESATTARSELERAYELCPTDHRIPAWLGPILIRMGRMLGDQSMVDEGFAVLQQGIDHYPAFVLFSKLLVHADEPAGSPEFSMALQAVDENTAACTASSSDPACLDTAIVPHNIEGSIVFLGDVYAKAGRGDDALAAYESGLAGPAYATWDWQALLADRIATVDARVAAFATPSESDDPSSIWQSEIQCSLCHRD